jgi:hypothetical protein
VGETCKYRVNCRWPLHHWKYAIYLGKTVSTTFFLERTFLWFVRGPASPCNKDHVGTCGTNGWTSHRSAAIGAALVLTCRSSIRSCREGRNRQIFPWVDHKLACFVGRNVPKKRLPPPPLSVRPLAVEGAGCPILKVYTGHMSNRTVLGIYENLADGL